MKGMPPETAIKRARINLLIDHPFFGNLAMNLRIAERKDLPFRTMAVDDLGNVFYDPDWVNTLAPDELQFVVAHEVMHLAMRHLTRRDGRQVGRWFKACDLAINSILVQSRVGRMPTDKKTGGQQGLHDNRYDGWSAEHIYNELPQEPEQGEGGGCDGDCANCEQGDQNSPDGRGASCPKGKGKPGEGSGDGDGGFHSGGGFDAHKEANTKGMSDQQRKEVEEQWKNLVARSANAARQQGKFPGGLEQIVGDLLYPKVDWRTVLWQFVNRSSNDDYRWFPPNRRHIHNGFNFPSMKSETFEIAVAVDTSGSISDEELKQFLSEVQAILEMNPSCTVHFYECDAGVHLYREYHAGDRVDAKVTGRGGTDFRPVFEDIQEKCLDIDCLVYLTDGYGSYPDRPPGYDVLWVMTTDYKVPWGDFIQMEVKEGK